VRKSAHKDRDRFETSSSLLTQRRVKTGKLRQSQPVPLMRNSLARPNARRVGFAYSSAARYPRLPTLDYRFSFCAVDQFLTCDAKANPWNCFEALAIDLLPTVEAIAKCALADPFQCRVH